jgi:hypothetical protein
MFRRLTPRYRAFAVSAMGSSSSALTNHIEWLGNENVRTAS